MRCASALFHPQVQEAEELLDASEAFPAGAFADAEVLGYPYPYPWSSPCRPDPSPWPRPKQVLGVLERLGMRSRVTRSAAAAFAARISNA